MQQACCQTGRLIKALICSACPDSVESHPIEVPRFNRAGRAHEPGPQNQEKLQINFTHTPGKRRDDELGVSAD